MPARCLLRVRSVASEVFVVTLCACPIRPVRAQTLLPKKRARRSEPLRVLLRAVTRSDDDVEENVSVRERLPVAGAALDNLAPVVGFDVGDQGGLVGIVAKHCLELGKSVDSATEVEAPRSLAVTLGLLEVLTVDGRGLRDPALQNEAESVFRRQLGDGLGVFGVDLPFRFPGKEKAGEQKSRRDVLAGLYFGHLFTSSWVGNMRF